MTTTVEHRPDAAARRSVRRPGPVARRAGYLIAACVNGVIWYLVNAHPTWHAVPFLTADFRTVLPLFNLSVVLAVAVNLAYLAYDARWFVAAGGVLTTMVGLAVLVRLTRVFPFDFPPHPDWTLVAHVVLVFAIVGAAVGLLVQIVTLAFATHSS